MDPKALTQFGEVLIRMVRDKEITYLENYIQSRELPDKLSNHNEIFESMTPEQIALVKELGIMFIDSVIHDVLYMLEVIPWIKVQIEIEGEIVKDIRSITNGDLQGYIFEWSEKFSTKPLSKE